MLAPPHSPSSRISLALAVAALALLGGCGGDGNGASDPSPAPAAEPAHIDVSSLEPCKDSRAPEELRCGSLMLPFERADPSLGRIRIAFAVRPRNDTSEPAESPIIAIEGGPGYGSIGSAKGYIRLFGSLLDHRDLILVDERGTGDSKPLDCPDLQSGRAPNELGLAECARRLGPRFASYRTSAAADDINDVREALGYDRVAVYGDSYGTYLAQSYAFRHGDSLDALVLDSAYPVRGESGWYPSIWRTGIRGLQIACRRSPRCDGDAASRLDRFVAELRDRRLSTGPLLDLIGSLGFSPLSSYVQLDRAIAAFLAGDPDPYRKLSRVGPAGYGAPSRYSFGQELAISCNDYPMIWDKDATEDERRIQLDDAIRDYPKRRFAPFTPREIALTTTVGYLECLSWPKPGPLYEPAAADDAKPPDVPVLVVSGDLDNVTSPAEARAAAALFPDSRVFVDRNGGHVYSLYDPRSDAAIRIRRFIGEASGHG